MNEIDAKRRMVSEATVMSLLQSEERRLASEKRWGEARERAMADLDEGTFTGEVEIIGLRPPEKRGEKRASGERCTEESEDTTGNTVTHTLSYATGMQTATSIDYP